jgi:hypothetical protein
LITLYLHIGITAAEAQYIQLFCSEHQQWLAEHGVLYPDIAREGISHNRLVYGLSAEGSEQQLERWAKRLSDQALASGAHAVLMSAELLRSWNKTGALEAFGKYFTVKVLAQLPRQDRFLQAEYERSVCSYSSRFAGSVYRFAFQSNIFNEYHYRFLLERWERVFGLDNIAILPVLESDTPRQLVATFLSQLHIESSLTENWNCEIRKPMSASALTYLAKLNQLAVSQVVHQQLISALAARFPAEQPGQLLSADEAESFYGKFRISNQYVFERYTDGGAEVLEQPAGGEAAAPWIDPDSVDLEVLRELITSRQLAPELLGLLS